MLLVAIIGKIFGFFGEFLRCAVRLVFGKVQLLCERIELELCAYLL